jgi:glycosyltransferase involved in cell wall biosynthesis
MIGEQTLLILTPIKDAAHHVDAYFAGIANLSYPRNLISIALLESDSHDNTAQVFRERLAGLNGTFRRTGFWEQSFGFRIPPGLPRHAPPYQVQRRCTLAKARNHLLFRALNDEDWVLWLDADVVEYPADIVERLLATGKDVVQPNCVVEYGGTSFDLNAWRDHGLRHLHDLRAEGELAPLDSVGGTMLLVRANLHRDGLVFPCFPYGLENPKIRRDNHWLGEIETEGFGIMAADMGIQCWGMPLLEIRHHPS